MQQPPKATVGNKFLQRQHINKQKGLSEANIGSKVQDEVEITPEEYAKAIQQIREELLAITLD